MKTLMIIACIALFAIPTAVATHYPPVKDVHQAILEQLVESNQRARETNIHLQEIKQAIQRAVPAPLGGQMIRCILKKDL